MRIRFWLFILVGIWIGFLILRYGHSLEGSPGEPSKPIYRTGIRNDPKALATSLPVAPLLPVSGLPSSVDLSSEFPPPYSQGNQASSVGFVLGYSLKSFTENRKKAHPIPLKNGLEDASDLKDAIFSPAYIYNLTNDGKDQGSSLLEGILLLAFQGILPWKDAPYREEDPRNKSFSGNRESLRFRIEDFYRILPSEIRQIQAQLHAGNPIPVTLLFFQNYLDLKPPYLLKDSAGEFIGVQAVLLVGYDNSKNAFLALNSWGENWGDKGRFWIDYSLFQKTAQAAYLVVDRPDFRNPETVKQLYPSEIAASQGNYRDRVRLSWKAVPGAIGYEIHRKRTVSERFQLIGISLDNQFEDTGIQTDLAYQYKIASVFPDDASELSPGSAEGFASSKLGEYLGEDITGLIASRGTYSDKIVLKWNPIPGRREYQIFKYNPYSGQFRALAKTNTNEYIDRRAGRNGELEFYRVGVLGGLSESKLTPAIMGYTSNRNSLLSSPVFVSASKGEYSDRVEIFWEPVNGAAYYKVYRYTKNSVWEELGETRENHFIDANIHSKEGYYSVVTYSKLGIPGRPSFPVLGIVSDIRERALVLPPPSNLETKLLPKDEKFYLLLQWKPVENAKEYKVYARNPGGTWSHLGTTSDSSFQDNIRERNWKLYAVASIDRNGIEGRKSKEHAFAYLPPVVDLSRNRAFGVESKLEKFKGPWTTMYWDGKATVTQVRLIIDSEDPLNEKVKILLNNRPIYQGSYIQETKIQDPRGRFTLALSESETSLNMEIRDRSIFPENTSLSFLRE